MCVYLSCMPLVRMLLAESYLRKDGFPRKQLRL
jgi:hypothetical protein